MRRLLGSWVSGRAKFGPESASALAQIPAPCESSRNEVTGGKLPREMRVEKAARVEFFEHFTEEAELAGLVGSDVENLRDAISGEAYEVKRMCKDFAKAAAKDGDADAAASFDEVRNDEKKHREAFEAMLEKVEASES
jgi:rubrerythrin